MVLYLPINGNCKLTLFCGIFYPMMVVTTKTTNIAVTKMTDSAAAITKTYKKPIYETIPRQTLIGYYEIIV